MFKYIAKPGGWYKAGTVVTLLDDYGPDLEMGLFEGIRVCENPDSEGRWHEVGDEYIDQEVCSFDEFEEVDE